MEYQFWEHYEKKIILFCIGVIVALWLFSKKCNIVIPNKYNKDITVGIIDGNLSVEHGNVLNSVIIKNDKQEKHSDFILDFLEQYDKNAKIVYYDAEKEGSITTESLIDGMKWMLDNDIDKVCISLSSSFYSKELEKIINNNRDNLEVYACYSNLYNTVDYPAQYSNVIGVGSNPKVAYKSSDIKYKSNKIILVNGGIYWYNGNSYLAPMQMIIDERNDNENGKD